MTSFLPAGTEVPSTPSQFLKLEEGSHRFRCLDSAITGREYWVETTSEDGTVKRIPKRVKIGESIPVEDIIDPDQPPKVFWAWVIWNYDAEAIQTLSITQKTIMRQLKTYLDDDDFGDPLLYDFVITRSGKGMETEYNLLAKPPKPLDQKIIDQYQTLKTDGSYDINRLYEGLYPLLTEKPVETKIDGKVKASKDEVQLDDIPF